MIAIGNTEISAAYVGSSEVDKVYCGNTVVYDTSLSLYDVVDYIQNSSGNAYIDTGFKPNNNTNFAFKIIPDSSVYLFGARTSATVNSLGFYSYLLYSNRQLARFDYGTSNYDSNSSMDLKQGAIWECSNNGNVMSINIEGNTSTITATSMTFQCEHNLHIYGVNNNGTHAADGNTSKIFYFKIYDNGVLIRDYIPVRRKSDGVYGLFDIINKTFNTSPNNELFTGGMTESIILNYQSIIDFLDEHIAIGSGNDFNRKRSTLFLLKTPANSIEWRDSTSSIFKDNYTLMHKQSNTLSISLNNPSYYIAYRVIVRNGTKYTNAFSSSWLQSINADLSSYTGDEVWVGVNFKFNNDGSAVGVLKDSDYTLTWL